VASDQQVLVGPAVVVYSAAALSLALGIGAGAWLTVVVSG
jgi:hypothetical protein